MSLSSAAAAVDPRNSALPQNNNTASLPRPVLKEQRKPRDVKIFSTMPLQLGEEYTHAFSSAGLDQGCHDEALLQSEASQDVYYV